MKHQSQWSATRFLGVLSMAMAIAAPANAEMTAEELAKLAQNPVGNLISVPFQNNTNFNVGPRDGTQNVLNIQPVIPIGINSEWNVITRTIMPVISQPAFVSGDDRTNGIGDIQLTGFLSPAVPKGAIWGAGAIVQMPTHSNSALGNDRWGLGPSNCRIRTTRRTSWTRPDYRNETSPANANAAVRPTLPQYCILQMVIRCKAN